MLDVKHTAQCVHRLTVLSHHWSFVHFGLSQSSGPDFLMLEDRFPKFFFLHAGQVWGPNKGTESLTGSCWGALGFGGERPMCFFAQHAAVHCSLVFAVGCSLGPLGICWFSLCTCSPPPPPIKMGHSIIISVVIRMKFMKFRSILANI